MLILFHWLNFHANCGMLAASPSDNSSFVPSSGHIGRDFEAKLDFFADLFILKVFVCHLPGRLKTGPPEAPGLTGIWVWKNVSPSLGE